MVVVAEEEVKLVVLAKHQLQILNHILQIGDEVEVFVVEDEVEDLKK